MRDPEQIPIILQALEREWRKSPDLRFGQFVVNLVDRNFPNPDHCGSRYAIIGMKDVRRFSLLGLGREDEVNYIREEPAKARENGLNV